MNRNLVLAGIGVAAIVLLGIGGFLLSGRQVQGGTATVSGQLCSNKPEAAKGLTNAAVTALRIEDTKEGSGPQAITSNLVKVHYIGRLTDGTQFDTSCERGEPFEFPLGGGRVIQGWDSGVVGMRVGGIRRLVIPAKLAYGDQSPSPNIPVNSALVFDVELIEIK
jgi:FKBP-type peptidyl-prolyl cis-trans isomerase